ncbi:MAG: saccharopine dehydrogenase NADP-binding domain-containing protein [Acidimicrobiia bacterium]|nr:saccharopine dehydrogenase NADP-binding domain-containing protein [Acidimicrobiia bacterium]
MTAYGVLGAGRQGTAAAYDLAVHGGATRVLLGDRAAEVAGAAAARLNHLLEREAVEPVEVDAADRGALGRFLEPLDAFVCAVPYALLLPITRAAIAAGTGMVDMGGHTDTVLAQLAMHPEARQAGVAVVPDCGMGPGMNNTLGLYAMELLRSRGFTPRRVHLLDGGLPQDRSAPWGYRLCFNLEGLTNEYDGRAIVLRGGRLTHLDTLTEVEEVRFEELGVLEAFVTSGGTSTVPYGLEDVLDTYDNKTLRYPGHLAAFKAFKDLGLFGRDAVPVGGIAVTPRDFYHALLGPIIETSGLEDVCVLRARAEGEDGTHQAAVVVDMVDRHDPATGFAAMERLTGWHAAIMAALIAAGHVPAGVHSLEKAVPASRFMEEARRRGFTWTERWEEG